MTEGVCELAGCHHSSLQRWQRTRPAHQHKLQIILTRQPYWCAHTWWKRKPSAWEVVPYMYGVHISVLRPNTMVVTATAEYHKATHKSIFDPFCSSTGIRWWDENNKQPGAALFQVHVTAYWWGQSTTSSTHSWPAATATHSSPCCCFWPKTSCWIPAQFRFVQSLPSAPLLVLGQQICWAS